MLSEYEKKQYQFWTKYYGALNGCVVELVQIHVEDAFGSNEFWPKLYLKAKDGSKYIVEVSRDEEGNGPGFLFGLPNVKFGDNDE